MPRRIFFSKTCTHSDQCSKQKSPPDPTKPQPEDAHLGGNLGYFIIVPVVVYNGTHSFICIYTYIAIHFFVGCVCGKVATSPSPGFSWPRCFKSETRLRCQVAVLRSNVSRVGDAVVKFPFEKDHRALRYVYIGVALLWKLQGSRSSVEVFASMVRLQELV